MSSSQFTNFSSPYSGGDGSTYTLTEEERDERERKRLEQVQVVPEDQYDIKDLRPQMKGQNLQLGMSPTIYDQKRYNLSPNSVWDSKTFVSREAYGNRLQRSLDPKTGLPLKYAHGVQNVKNTIIDAASDANKKLDTAVESLPDELDSTFAFLNKTANQSAQTIFSVMGGTWNLLPENKRKGVISGTTTVLQAMDNGIVGLAQATGFDPAIVDVGLGLVEGGVGAIRSKAGRQFLKEGAKFFSRKGPPSAGGFIPITNVGVHYPNANILNGGSLLEKGNALAIKGSDQPFYPELKPHRAYKTTSKLKTLEDYKQAWRDWPDKTKVGRDAFYKKYGQWIDEGNFKFKPDHIRQSPEDKAAGIKRFTSEMNIRSDKGIWTRKQRGDILTYMSGEAPISTTKASYKDPITGHNIIPHHRTSHGELAPWVDIIIEKLNSPDPKIKAEGKQMLEIGKAVFAKAKIKVGDTLKNYEGYFHKAHLGPGSIHDKLTEHRITGPSSRSAFDFTKGENALSKGIKVGDKIIPTKEYIQQLPWKPGGNTGEFGENTFWTSLVDYIQTSNAARQTAREEVLTQFGPQGKNWAGGEL